MHDSLLDYGLPDMQTSKSWLICDSSSSPIELKAQCPAGGRRELHDVKSISTYDAVSPRSVKYAKDWHDAEARRSKLFVLLTLRAGEELAGSIVAT